MVVRVVIAALGLAFWLLATLAVLVGRVPRELAMPLEASFGFLSLLTAGAFLRAQVPRRVKIGVALFALPAALHVGSALLDSIGWLRGKVPGSDLAPWGEAWLILAATTAPFTLVPLRDDRGRWRVPLSLASLLTAIFVVVLKRVTT